MGLALLLGLGWAARVAFISVLPIDWQCFDLNSWHQVAEMLQAGKNPYASGLLNWPPLWLQIIYALTQLSQKTGVPLIALIKLFLIAVESLVIGLVYLQLCAWRNPRFAWRLCLAGFALNPLALLLIGQHGNFDVLMCLWCVGALLALLRFHRTGQASDWLLACFLVGLGVLTKTVPLVLLPALAFGAQRLRVAELVFGLALVILPAALGLSVLYVLTPQAIQSYVLSYRSEAGSYGISGLLHLWGLDRWQSLPNRLFNLGYFSFLGLWAWVNRTRKPTELELLLTSLAALLAVPTLGPGFAPQYAYWFLPLTILGWPFFSAGLKRATLLAWIVAAATYVVEYASLAVFGWFVVGNSTPPMSWGLAIWSWMLEQKELQCCFRLPLFASCLAWLGVMALTLWREYRAALPNESARTRKALDLCEAALKTAVARAKPWVPAALLLLAAIVCLLQPSPHVCETANSKTTQRLLLGLRLTLNSEMMLADNFYKAGRRYLPEDGTPKQPRTAFIALRQAARLGDPRAQSLVAEMCRSGQGTTTNLEQFVYWARKSAFQGDSVAQGLLSIACYKGVGVPVQPEEGFKWARKAAAAGEITAQKNLAIAYRQGLGTAVDTRQSIYWLQQAAAQNDSECAYQLALDYSSGNLLPRNDTEAARWCRLAAEQNHPPAQLLLSSLYREGKGVPTNQALALAWCQKSAAREWPRAQYFMGLRCLSGEGVPVDLPAAQTWLTRAALQQEGDAMKLLSDLFLQSRSSSNKNIIAAWAWAELASRENIANAAAQRDLIAKQMSTADLAQGKHDVQQLAAQIAANLAAKTAP